MKHMHKFIARLLFFFLCFTVTVSAYGQERTEMADALRSDGKIYVVVTCMAVIFVGLLVYLLILDKKVNRLEKLIKEHKN